MFKSITPLKYLGYKPRLSSFGANLHGSKHRITDDDFDEEITIWEPDSKADIIAFIIATIRMYESKHRNDHKLISKNIILMFVYNKNTLGWSIENQIKCFNNAFPNSYGSYKKYIKELLPKYLLLI